MFRDRLALRIAYTLAEIAIAVALTGVLAGIAAPALTRGGDARAVRAAMAEAANALALARDEALAQRALSVVQLDTAAGAIVVSVRRRLVRRFMLRASHGVTLSATRDSVAFDARGLGYGAANLTLVARRGRAADTLVMSRLGRVRY